MKNIRFSSFTATLLVTLATGFLATSCENSNEPKELQKANADETASISFDEGEYITAINNTSRSWIVEFGKAEHSDQWDMDGKGTKRSGIIEPGGRVALNWQASNINPWLQEINFYDTDGTTLIYSITAYGRGKKVDVENFLDETANIFIKMGVNKSDTQTNWAFAGAFHYMEPYAQPGWGHMGFLDIRDAWKPDGFSYSKWMTYVDDNKKFIDLGMPGTHDAGTWNTLIIPAKCQSQDWFEQMNWGVRTFDLRLSDQMKIYHGIIYCHNSLKDFLQDAVRFLNENPGEFIIAMVKDENCDEQDKYYFNNKFNKFIRDYGQGKVVCDKTFAEKNIGDLRGKIYVVTRDRSEGSMGWIKDAPQINWHDDTTVITDSDFPFEIYLSDEYTKTPENKVDGVAKVMASATASGANRWNIIFTSGYNTWQKIPNPWLYAASFNIGFSEILVGGKGMVRNFKQYWREASIPATGNLGTVLMDFSGSYETDLIRDQIIFRNYQKLPAASNGR